MERIGKNLKNRTNTVKQKLKSKLAKEWRGNPFQGIKRSGSNTQANLLNELAKLIVQSYYRKLGNHEE